MYDIYLNASKISAFTRFNKFSSESDRLSNILTCNYWISSLLNKNIVEDVEEENEENIFKMSKGIQNECISLDKFEKTYDVKIIKRNEKIYKKILLSITYKNKTYKIIVGGKIDGLTEDGNTIVETKCRMYKLFNEIRDYEKVQLEIYLWLCDKDRCIFVENYEGIQNTMNYYRNPKFMEVIKEDVKNYFVNFLQEYL